MAIPLLVTIPGAANSNSYSDEQYFRDYAERRPHSVDLSGYVDEALRPFLLQAMVLIENMEPYGQQTNVDGSLLFPRIGVFKKNRLAYYDSGEIPADLKDAQCEIAMSYVKSDVMSPSSLAGFDSIKIGNIDLKQKIETEPSPVNSTAKTLLDHLFYSVNIPGHGKAGSVRVA